MNDTVKLDASAFKDKLFMADGMFSAKMNEDESLVTITGYASTNDKDRDGDIVAADAWKEPTALSNYLNNPIILSNHDSRLPIGKMVSHEIDAKGLKITAEISKAAGNVFDLVKQGVLKTFSIGFRIKDADWNSALDAFLVKSVELFEISVVSIPANQSAVFSVAKQFDTDDEYMEFKNQHKPTEEPIKMDPKDTNKGITEDAMAKAIASAIASNQKRMDDAAEAEKAVNDRVSGEVKTALERYEADAAKTLASVTSEKETLQAAVAKLTADMGDQTQELNAARKAKMSYNGDASSVKEYDKQTAVFLAKAMGVPVSETKFFKDMATKSGEDHWSAGAQTTDWEQDFSTTILSEVRAMLRVESAFTTSIAMPTASFHLPVNPEAGLAEWITTANQRGPNSTGTAAEHQLKDITLVAKKMAAKEYVGYEEEEDALIAIMPIVREALSRKMARTSDKSFLLGTASTVTGAVNGISGMDDFATALSTTLGIGANDVLTAANLTAMRASLGIHGLDTVNLVYFVSTLEYYNLLEDTNFKTIDLIGDKATLLTGQIGMVGGVPVVVSDEFLGRVIGNAAAYCINVKNFIKGELRGLMVETDKDIEEQKNIIVATRRLDLIELQTGVGSARINYAA